MNVAVYNRYWSSMGGGERHSGMIAEVLSADGHDVDLIGHEHVSRDELEERLALDLGSSRLRIVPDRGEAEMSVLSGDYDLFVNSTYMSRVAARSVRAAYLCFFPTPFDHDLDPVRRAAVRHLGSRLGTPRTGFVYGSGWFPREGGKRRQWVWTSGEGQLYLEPGPERTLEADWGRPGVDEPAEVTVNLNGATFTRFVVTPAFSRASLIIPAAETKRLLTFCSSTFSPGTEDVRRLGVAMSRPRLIGQRLRPRDRLLLRFPWLRRNPTDLSFLRSYDLVLANSIYTQHWIQRSWRHRAEVLYPPIDTASLSPASDRARTILSVGRFFSPKAGHCKRQLEMVQMFGELLRRGALAGWKLVVVGGCEAQHRPYLEQVRAAARGLPVEIHPNAPRRVVTKLLDTASIFWSATGFGENVQKRPWTNEHFGMTTVEAMAGGCVPVVIDRAGQREVVRDGIDGFRWSTPAELQTKTIEVAADGALRSRLAASAVERAEDFSDASFDKRWHQLAEQYRLLG